MPITHWCSTTRTLSGEGEWQHGVACAEAAGLPQTCRAVLHLPYPHQRIPPTPPRPSRGNHRKLRVTAQPNVTLAWEHLPARCRRARTLLLGPLMPEVRQLVVAC